MSARAQVADEVLGDLQGPQREEAETLVGQLVDGWLDNLGDLDPDDVVAIGTRDLQRDLEGLPGEQRVAKLRDLVLDRQVSKVSTRAFQLARSVADDERSADDAADEAGALLLEIERLLPTVHSLDDEERKRRLLRSLADADMECHWVRDPDNAPTSIRLGRHLG